MAKQPPPLPPEKAVTYIVSAGAYLPVMTLRLWEANAWEDFVLECCLQMKVLDQSIISIKRLGGAGDKGRDVEVLVKMPRTTHAWDLYQCKHYDSPIAPSAFFPELFKFFTNMENGSYPEPNHYFLCAPQDCGTDLSDLLTGQSVDFQNTFIEALRKGTNGLKDCSPKLTSSLEATILNFDFSRIREFQARDLLKWHERDGVAHFRRFGVRPQRPKSPKVPKKPKKAEQKYIEALLSAYSEDLGSSIDVEHLSFTPHVEHFEGSRSQFYSAEGLRMFSRDIFPDQFDELLDEVLAGVKPSIANSTLDTGLKRLHKAIEVASTLKITENSLSSNLRGPDLPGTCHHLANKGKVKWVK